MPDSTSESHQYPWDMEHQPPPETTNSLRRVAQETRAGRGPRAEADTLLRDLRSRGLRVMGDEVRPVRYALG